METPAIPPTASPSRPRARRPILSWRIRQFLAAQAARQAAGGGASGRQRPILSRPRIALVKWDAIGDFVLATTLLRVFRDRVPPDRITLFCQQAVAPLARAQYGEWQIVELPPRVNPLRRIYGQPAVRRLLKSQKTFDWMLDMRAMRDMGDSVLASWIPASTKIGLVNQYTLPEVRLAGEERLYDRLYVAPTASEEGVPQDIQNYRFLAQLSFPEDPPAAGELWPHLEVEDTARRSLADRLAQRHGVDCAQPYLLVCPGSLDAIKEYPPARLAEAIRQLWSVRSLPVLVAGTAADERTAKPLAAALQGHGPVHDLTGLFDLVEHAALISTARAVLCMDSATAHMAGALGRPAVVVLGGGQPGIFGPWGVSRRFRWLQHRLPCYGCNWLCIYDRPLCIEGVPPSAIAQNLLEVLMEPA